MAIILYIRGLPRVYSEVARAFSEAARAVSEAARAYRARYLFLLRASESFLIDLSDTCKPSTLTSVVPLPFSLISLRR